MTSSTSPPELAVGILATGDEILNGTIVNSNGQYAAARLFDSGITIGTHLVTSDVQKDIENAISYLLNQYSTLIIIGGLGPTSDDRTRFALAAVTNQELHFDDASWNLIVQRLTHLKIPIADTNKQQCLFPVGATVLPNLHGTASGCVISHNNQTIFMLPGPPHEFIPMFENSVLPRLIATALHHLNFQCSWLLLGMSESAVAAKLDPMMDSEFVTIHYRVTSPYIEVKLQSQHLQLLQKFKEMIDPILVNHMVSEKNQIASEQLLLFLSESEHTFAIQDHATFGQLQSKLLTPETWQKVKFDNDEPEDFVIEITGLNEYWNAQPASNSTSVTIDFLRPKKFSVTQSLFLRGPLTLIHAVEIISWQILVFLRS